MTSVKNILATTLLGVSLSGCIVVAKPSYADWHQQKELSLSSHQLDALVVEAGAGKLNIKGQNGLDEITVIADIYTSKSAQQDYELTLEQRGSRAYLVAKNESTSGFWVGDSPKIDVVVHVPSQLRLDIDDGSGDIEVKNAGDLNVLESGSGELQISGIIGTTKIDS